jgi:ferritin-like metal-binding protein YciE
MKQSSTTSTRGRKKTANGKSTPSRGAAATQQNRNRNGATSRSNGAASGNNASSSRGGNSGQRNSADRGDSSRNSGNERTAPRSNSSVNTGNERTAARGNGPGISGNAQGSRDRGQSRSSGSAQHAFTGETHLEKFFLDQLRDIYYAENKIIQSLPKMAEAATTNELKDAFEDHLHQTQRHAKRLEKAFESLGKKAEGKKCEAIEGIAREVDNIIEETEEGTLTRDAALIIAAQKVEHYEIATYGGLVQLAITMNLHDAADLLDKTLVEEEDTDARLTEIAENDINLRAEHEDTQSTWNAGEQEGEEENGNVEEKHPSL